MAICWERVVPLAFPLCCFYFSAVLWDLIVSVPDHCLSFYLVVRVPFPFGVYGRVWNSIVSVPDHCLFIYFGQGFFLSSINYMTLSKESNVRKV